LKVVKCVRSRVCAAMARGFGAKRKRAPAKEGEGLVEEVEGDVLGIDIDSEVVKNEVAKEFQESKPYRHCVLKELCNEKVLRKVRDEIITNLRATFKETDIYKVLQTGDLANLDGLDKNSLGQLPHLKRLRDTIYSKEFRTFVESVAGLGEDTHIATATSPLLPPFPSPSVSR